MQCKQRDEIANLNKWSLEGIYLTKNEMKQWKIVYGRPKTLGVTKEGTITYFSIAMESSVDSFLHLYKKESEERFLSIPLEEKYRFGDVYTIGIDNLPTDELEYTYENNQIEFVDPRAKKISGRRTFGAYENCDKSKIRGVVATAPFDWEEDKPLGLTYEEMILYRLHVRGFTKHVSSKVKHKGTYLGIVEKLPYLKELGINAIELMPAYAFQEVIEPSSTTMGTTGYQAFLQQQNIESEPAYRINYWGYTNDAFYMAPKESYSSREPDLEFKQLVKECHKAGIEVIMEFYFEQGVNPLFVHDCFHHWVQEYHVDGFHFNSNGVNPAFVGADPYLSKVKLMCDYIPVDEIYPYRKPEFENMAVYNDCFQTDIRRFLKGDEEHTSKFGHQFKSKPAKIGKINYITNTNGFTLGDLYSYDIKHNEANGEDNKDGTDYNYSWNCGKEGVTRSKKVLEQRQRQIRNALLTVFLSQGTPLLLAGDEFLNTQHGNNNAYCQDNEISWLNWNQRKSNEAVFQFVQKMIALRKAHPILHRHEEFRQMDYISCGFPDLSFHGTKAWYPNYSNYSRVIGLLLCGKYVKINRADYDESFYFAYNMHWESHTFDLPTPPKDKEWCVLLDTSQAFGTEAKELSEFNQDVMVIKPHSVVVLISKTKK